MKHMWLALVLAILTSPARADFFNGNELHAACSLKTTDGITAYVAAIYDKALADGTIVNFFVTASEVKRNPDLAHIAKSIKPYCVSDAVSLGQLKDVVCKWLVDNPARRHYPGAVIVPTALGDAFPCK